MTHTSCFVKHVVSYFKIFKVPRDVKIAFVFTWFVSINVLKLSHVHMVLVKKILDI